MITAYMYQAALLCDDCTRSHLINTHDIVLVTFPDYFSGGGHLIRTDDMLATVLRFEGADPENESSWDSDKFPKSTAGLSDEADTPQHCDHCQLFLENRLTGDGYEYVLQKLLDDDGDADVLQLWRDFYGDDFMTSPGRERVSINDIVTGKEGEHDSSTFAVRYHKPDDDVLPLASESDNPAGWYWWHTDGPNNTAFGPFATADDAQDDAQEDASNEPLPWLMAGDWFIDSDGALYIVPLPEIVAECHGPDNDTMNKINAACRDHDRLTDDDCTALGLTRVAEGLKRHDKGGLGYHSA